MLSANQTSPGPVHRAREALLGKKKKKRAIKIESNDSALENQRTNNYIIREEGPEGYRSVCSAIFRHIGNNYGEEFLKIRNNDWRPKAFQAEYNMS